MLESKSTAASARGYVFLQSRFKETLKAQAVPRKQQKSSERAEKSLYMLVELVIHFIHDFQGDIAISNGVL